MTVELRDTEVESRPMGDVLADACVVIVDDQRVNIMILERMLHAVGVREVHSVTDPRQAVRRCREVGADLVLLDLHMPHVDGYAVLAELRDTTHADELLPVLVLTADTTARSRDRALRAGAKDFLAKPLDYTEVALRVTNLLETRALHVTLQQRNATLRADLDARAEAERRHGREQQELSERIDTALAPGALGMVFQPIADLHGGDTVGFEALARFACEPLRSPDRWFADAAALGRGEELELAAVRAALEQLGRLPGGAFLSLNVSPAVAMTPALESLLCQHDLERVVLELTEHAPVHDYPSLQEALARLRSGGVRVAIDDTGVGYAGLDHLLQLRPQIVKLDLALTRQVDRDPARRALATALVAFTREIGATIVAEGIETGEELATLREIGVGWGQGYHLGRPAPLLAENLVPAPVPPAAA